MSGYQFGWAQKTTLTIGAPPKRANFVEFISIEDFEKRFSCAVNSVPQNVCLLGWSRTANQWYCAPDSLRSAHASSHAAAFHARITRQHLDFLSSKVLARLDGESVWFFFCFYDGWRERVPYSTNYRWVDAADMTAWPEWSGEPGALPRLSPTRDWIACYGAHHGDPSALLFPDAHYFMQNFYQPLFAEVSRASLPWAERKSRAVLACGDHGERANFFSMPTDTTLHPRRQFRNVAAEQKLDVDVYLGKQFSRADQMTHKFIADVDGFARTWDAWAWKMMSGSAVLSVASPWESFFSRSFQPWEHFVPVENDCADLAEKLQWCRDNDGECEAIAQRARAHATRVYDPAVVADELLANLRGRVNGG